MDTEEYPQDLCLFGPGKALRPEDGILEPVALMEGVEAQVLYKTDTVDLELARPAKAIRTG